MSVEIRLPTLLRPAVEGKSTVSVSGSTIGEVLRALENEHPTLKGQLLGDDGNLHRFVNIYLNDDDVRYLDRLDTKVADDDVVSILPAVAAGRGRSPLFDPVPIARSVLDLIGNTPMVDVSELSPSPAIRLFLKLEGANPGGSVKDRIALSLVEDAESKGVLRPGSTLIEPSSGNTGIGLALVCRIKGYTLKIVLPENASPERRQLLEVWGAEVIESPGSQGSNGAVRLAQRLAAEHPEWVFLYQYGNHANPEAHYRGTGPEIWRDCPDVTHFVAGLGTSGTLLGVGRYLKEQNPDIEICAVEPPAGELVDGLRNLDDGFIPPIFEDLKGEELLGGRTIVGPKDSILWTRRLSDIGIFAGLSTGAAMAGAVKRASRLTSGVIVVLSPDGGWKYLSTGAWSGDIDEVAERARSWIYF